jgi:hypothetical protein
MVFRAITISLCISALKPRSNHQMSNYPAQKDINLSSEYGRSAERFAGNVLLQKLWVGTLTAELGYNILPWHVHRRSSMETLDQHHPTAVPWYSDLLQQLLTYRRRVRPVSVCLMSSNCSSCSYVATGSHYMDLIWLHGLAWYLFAALDTFGITRTCGHTCQVECGPISHGMHATWIMFCTVSDNNYIPWLPCVVKKKHFEWQFHVDALPAWH